MWKLNNIQLNRPWVKEEIKEEIRKYLVMNENENTTYKTWDTEKVELREKFIALNAYIKKKDLKSITQCHTLRNQEKEEQTKWKTSKKKEIIIIRMNINEIENKKE